MHCFDNRLISCKQLEHQTPPHERNRLGVLCLGGIGDPLMAHTTYPENTQHPGPRPTQDTPLTNHKWDAKTALTKDCGTHTNTNSSRSNRTCTISEAEAAHKVWRICFQQLLQQQQHQVCHQRQTAITAPNRTITTTTTPNTTPQTTC